MRAGASGGLNGFGGSGGGVGGTSKELVKARLVEGGMVSAMWLALSERRARALGASAPTDAGAIHTSHSGELDPPMVMC